MYRLYLISVTGDLRGRLTI